MPDDNKDQAAAAAQVAPGKTGPQAAAPGAESGIDKFDALVEKWFAEHFHGTEVARDTRTFNVAQRAKEELKKLLKSV